MLSEQARLRRKLRARVRSRRYDARHRMIRERFAPLVAAGLAECVRCGEPIEPGPWDLGHDDRHPGLHTGPEHASCNRGAPHRNKTSRQW
jgi:hypothetical protein